jgi:hypothetical protein
MFKNKSFLPCINQGGRKSQYLLKLPNAKLTLSFGNAKVEMLFNVALRLKNIIFDFYFPYYFLFAILTLQK